MSSNKDYSVSPVGMSDGGPVLAGANLPKPGALNMKPPHLVILEDSSGKTKTRKYFISLEKPGHFPSHIECKGIFCDMEEEEITKNFSSILTSADKELFIEVMLPWHKICSIRNLIYRQK